MPAALYHKEAADAKTAKDCKDGYDNTANLNPKSQSPNVSEEYLKKNAHLSKAQFYKDSEQEGKATSDCRIKCR